MCLISTDTERQDKVYHSHVCTQVLAVGLSGNEYGGHRTVIEMMGCFGISWMRCDGSKMGLDASFVLGAHVNFASSKTISSGHRIPRGNRHSGEYRGIIWSSA